MSARVHYSIEHLPGGYLVSTWAIEDRREVTLLKAGQQVLDITPIYSTEACREALKRLPHSLPELRVMVTVGQI